MICRWQKSFNNVKRWLSTSKCWDYDVVINGGGVVGAALAADLLLKSRGNCKIAIIEPQQVKELKVVRSLPEVRVYALAPQSINFLKSIGAWELIQQRSHPYTEMQVWESTGPGLVKFHADKMSVDELGRICEDSTIQSAIYQTIKQSGFHVDIISNETILDVTFPDSTSFKNDAVSITLISSDKTNLSSTPRQLNARLLVGADGSQSIVRRLAGITTWGWNYGVEGIVATVSLNNDSQQIELPDTSVRNNTAWQNYLSTGPLALLPLWDGYASIVWSVPTALAKQLKALTDEEFLTELNTALHKMPQSDQMFSSADSSGERSQIISFLRKELNSVSNTLMASAHLMDPFVIPPEVKRICSKRMSFPLAFQQAKEYVKPRMALIGDAAHSIHPQAGQGLNLGLADAACLSSTIEKALSSGEDFGSFNVLESYAKERYIKNLMMMSAVDSINTIFQDRINSCGSADTSVSSPLVKGKKLLRSLGMLGVHSLGPLKHEMAKYAMGLK